MRSHASQSAQAGCIQRIMETFSCCWPGTRRKRAPGEDIESGSNTGSQKSAFHTDDAIISMKGDSAETKVPIENNKSDNLSVTRKASTSSAFDKRSYLSMLGDRKLVRLVWVAEPGTIVLLAGSYDNWESMVPLMQKKDQPGIYETRVVVPLGEHEYRFLVNDQWECDGNRPIRQSDRDGLLVNVLTLNP